MNFFLQLTKLRLWWNNDWCDPGLPKSNLFPFAYSSELCVLKIKLRESLTFKTKKKNRSIKVFSFIETFTQQYKGDDGHDDENMIYKF